MRFKAKYKFDFDSDLEKAISNFDVNRFDIVSKERIRDEFIKCLNVNVNFFEYENLFQYLFEIDINKIDNKDNVIEHINNAIKLSNNTNMKLAALLHDLGKFSTESYNEKQKRYQYIGHEVISTEIAVKFLLKFKFTNKTRKFVVQVVTEHMNIKFFLERKIIKQIKYVLQNKELLNEIVIFNGIDWKAKPKTWQSEMNTDQQQEHIINTIDRIVVTIPDRKVRKEIAKKKGDFITNLALFIRDNLDERK